MTLSHLIAYLSRNAGELWIRSKRGEILHSLDERGRGNTASFAILIRKISIQGLWEKHKHSNTNNILLVNIRKANASFTTTILKMAQTLI